MFDYIPLTLAQEDASPAPGSTPQAPAGGNGEPGTVQDGAPGDGGPPPTGAPPGMGIWYIMLAVLMVFMFMSIRSQSKEKKKRQQMIASLVKGAKVQTVGGVIGTVVDLRDNEIVLKVDENTNTRIKFNRSSVQSVLDGKTES